MSTLKSTRIDMDGACALCVEDFSAWASDRLANIRAGHKAPTIRKRQCDICHYCDRHCLTTSPNLHTGTMRTYRVPSPLPLTDAEIEARKEIANG